MTTNCLWANAQRPRNFRLRSPFAEMLQNRQLTSRQQRAICLRSLYQFAFWAEEDLPAVRNRAERRDDRCCRHGPRNTRPASRQPRHAPPSGRPKLKRHGRSIRGRTESDLARVPRRRSIYNYNPERLTGESFGGLADLESGISLKQTCDPVTDDITAVADHHLEDPGCAALPSLPTHLCITVQTCHTPTGS